MISFEVGLKESAALASTMAFATLTLARLFHGFNCRSRHSIVKIGFRRNWYSLGAFALGVLLLALVLFVPALKTLFEVETMNGMQLGCVGVMAVLPTFVIQNFKVAGEVSGREK